MDLPLMLGTLVCNLGEIDQNILGVHISLWTFLHPVTFLIDVSVTWSTAIAW